MNARLTSNIRLLGRLMLFMIEAHLATVLIGQGSPGGGTTNGALPAGIDGGNLGERRQGDMRQTRIRLVVVGLSGDDTGPLMRGERQWQRGVGRRYRHAIGGIQGHVAQAVVFRLGRVVDGGHFHPRGRTEMVIIGAWMTIRVHDGKQEQEQVQETDEIRTRGLHERIRGSIKNFGAGTEFELKGGGRQKTRMHIQRSDAGGLYLVSG